MTAIRTRSGRQRRLGRLAGALVLALAAAFAAVLFASASASAAGAPLTGRFSFEDSFDVNPGDPASCPFTIHIDLQAQASFQLLQDAQGAFDRLLLHEHWVGTVSANGRQVTERAALSDVIDLQSGADRQSGQIHELVPFAGVAIHDSGLVQFDGAGNVTFEAGAHQGLDGDPAALARFCAALS